MTSSQFFIDPTAPIGFNNIDATDGNVTITVPTATDARPRAPVYYRKVDASANTVTITDSGSFSSVLETQDDTLLLISDGTSYRATQQSSTDASSVAAALAAHAVATTGLHGVGAGAVMGTTLAQSASQKTLVTPKFANGDGLYDDAGRALLLFGKSATAVNQVTVTNKATGTGPTVAATGTDTDINLNLVPKGAGVLQISGVAAPTASSMATAIAAEAAARDAAIAAAGQVLIDRFASEQIALRSPLSASNLPFGAALTSGTAYWIYLGQTDRDITVSSAQFVVTTGGTGAQTAEIAFGSSNAAPLPAGNSITTAEAVPITADLTTTGLKSQAFAGTFGFGEGAHMWLGFRTAMALTQPVLSSLIADMGRGYVGTTAAAGALVASTGYTAAVPAGGTLLSSPNAVLTIILI